MRVGGIGRGEGDKCERVGAGGNGGRAEKRGREVGGGGRGAWGCVSGKRWVMGGMGVGGAGRWGGEGLKERRGEKSIRAGGREGGGVRE